MVRAWGRTALPPLLILGLLRLHFSPLVVAQGAPPSLVHAITLAASARRLDRVRIRLDLQPSNHSPRILIPFHWLAGSRSQRDPAHAYTSH